MATQPNRQLFNFRGQIGRNLGKPKEANDALTWALPQYTSTEISTITATNGMLIYNSTTNKIQGYQAGSWQNLI